MTTHHPSSTELDYLLQVDVVQKFIKSLGHNPWQTVYSRSVQDDAHLAVDCAFLTHDTANEALQRFQWDLWDFDASDFSGLATSQVRPLVIERQFEGAFPPYLEISEFFRLHYNLAYDPKRQLLLDFDHSGYEIQVAELSNKEVTVSWAYLSRFLRETGLCFAFYIDSIRFSDIDLAQVPARKRRIRRQNRTECYYLCVAQCNWKDNRRTFSRLVGKRVIRPSARSGNNPRQKHVNKDVSFIIGVKPDGSHRVLSSSPEKLRDSPEYVRPVFFRREVLTKYYSAPARYTIEDGYISCLGLWGMRIFNSHPEYVIAFLGDLGQYLPYEERLYWRSFNLPPPADASLSKSFHESELGARFRDTASVDHYFLELYDKLNSVWNQRFGWPLFLKLPDADKHLRSLHIPVTDSQREFDEQILTLAKLMVDSLNEKQLKTVLLEEHKNSKGIDKLERFLLMKNFRSTVDVVSFFRDLQSLRSAGSAHRKGSKYDKLIESMGFAEMALKEIMIEILRRAIVTLSKLLDFAHSVQ